MSYNTIKVLVVDDAAFMVKALTEMLSSDPQLEVVGVARNGQEAREKIPELRPDVITLDVDMPVMDGIRTVRHLMIESPVPVIMLSSLSGDGAITFEALRLGVVDFVPKPSGAVSRDISSAKQEVIDRIKMAASVDMKNIHRVRLQQRDIQDDALSGQYGFQALEQLVVVGTTLGGPNTLIRLLTQLSPKLPISLVVSQKINPKVIDSFVSKFNEYVPWRIEVAKDGEILEQGVCYIAPDKTSIRIGENEEEEICLQLGEEVEQPLNELFTSAAYAFGNNTIGLLLAGIGDDGAKGLGDIQSMGGKTIAQAINSYVTPNLTDNAINEGTVDHVVEESDLPAQIESLING